MKVAIRYSVLYSLALVLLAVSMSGCEFMRAVTFTSDDVTSFQRAGSRARLEVYPSADGDCLAGPEDTKTMAAIEAGLISAGAVIALNVIEGEIKSYLDKKKSEFTATYATAESIDAFYPRKAAYRMGFDCIRFRRSLDKDDTQPPFMDDDRLLAMELVVRMVPSPNQTAMKLRPERLTLVRAAARTDQESKGIEITVQIKLDAVATNEKGVAAVVTVADKVLGIPDLHTTGDRKKAFTVLGMQTPGCIKQKPGYKVVTKDGEAECRDLRETSWFEAVPKSDIDIKKCDETPQPPGTKDRTMVDDGAKTKNQPPACTGVTPITLALSVTETGSGADTFGAASKIIDDNKGTFNDAIRDAIKEGLTKSGGS